MHIIKATHIKFKLGYLQMGKKMGTKHPTLSKM